MLALRLAVFEHLVDIGRIAELRGIERRDGSLWIGAGTTDADGRTQRRGRERACRCCAKATPFVGHFQIRNRGTVGGSIAHADPAAEYPAVALALDATMHVLSPRGTRTIAARDFFDGVWSTTMDDDELLVGVSFPVWGSRSGFAVEEIARRHGDFAIAGATVGVELDDDDRITRCAIGLFGMGLDAAAGDSGRAASHGQPCRRDRHDRARTVGGRGPGLDPGRPARFRDVPRDGSARSWWRGRGRARARKQRMGEVPGHDDGQRRRTHGRRSSPA